MKRKLICASTLLALHCSFAHAQLPPGDPEVAITSCEELQDINNNLAGNYYLANDIDCAGFYFDNANLGFMPIGDADTPFTGKFDGQGFTISNVVINRPSMNYVGVFGYAGIRNGATDVVISDVNLTGIEITGNSHVGGLFGQLYDGTIENINTEGTVRGNVVLGGLGGDAVSSSISHASSSGSVIMNNPTGNTSQIFYGGLIGGNERSEISCSSSDAEVTGNYRVGGLVGNNSGTITNSFATGAVEGFYRVGGLAGENVSGEISDCFATGSVTGFSGSHELGGLVGLQYGSAAIKRSYATGKVSKGIRTMGGILGLKLNGTCSDTYWDVETSEISGDACGSGSVGLTTHEMQNQSTYFDWDFGDTWTMNGYPVLQCGADDNTDPIADAGENQSVVQGEEVCFDGSGSSDADNDELSYSWSLTEWPAGSSAVLDNPTVDTPCIIADLPGTYQVGLTVNDGTIDSAPSTAEVVAISYLDAVIVTLQEALDKVNELDSSIFSKKNSQENLVKGIDKVIDKVITQVENGSYDEALFKLEGGSILLKTDGCVAPPLDEPNSDDWIISCESQELVYPLIMEAIGYMNEL
uniref:GLUG motif-containing protein n=1 Tax=Candidatus Electrothrix sp. TaxID=2170559 RepID=UPI004057B7FE